MQMVVRKPYQFQNYNVWKSIKVRHYSHYYLYRSGFISIKQTYFYLILFVSNT